MKEHTAEYDRYIRSEAWKKKCEERARIDNFRCCMCGKKQENCTNGKLQCHHIRYSKYNPITRQYESIIGKENVYEDLCSLCNRCHLLIHHYYDRTKSETG